MLRHDGRARVGFFSTGGLQLRVRRSFLPVDLSRIQAKLNPYT